MAEEGMTWLDYSQGQWQAKFFVCLRSRMRAAKAGNRLKSISLDCWKFYWTVFGGRNWLWSVNFRGMANTE